MHWRNPVKCKNSNSVFQKDDSSWDLPRLERAADLGPEGCSITLTLVLLVLYFYSVEQTDQLYQLYKDDKSLKQKNGGLY